MTPRLRKLVIALGVISAGVGLLAAPAGAQEEPSGSASGLEGLLDIPLTNITLPPLPLIELPPGGTNEVLGLSLPPLVSTDVLQVASNETPDNGSESSASVAGLEALPGVAEVAGELIASSCQATPSSSSGDASLVDTSVLGIPVAVTPQPNTSIAIPGLGSVTLNEQTTEGGRTTVRAVHVAVDAPLIAADLAVATSTCAAGAGGGPGGPGGPVTPEIPVAEAPTPTPATPTLAG